MSKNRTSITHLPHELLLMIFNCFEKKDLLNCQRVCKAWYISSHPILLNCISLNCISSSTDFINAIDFNPNPTYLNAVKKIKIAYPSNRRSKKSDNRALQNFTRSRDTPHKLFFRFPNLTHVEIDKHYFLRTFTDELCQTMLKCCPKLETFEVKRCVFYERVPVICYVRLLLTKVNVERISSSTENPSRCTIDYITSFPRMRQLQCEDINSEDLLTVLERSPNLRELNVPITALPRSVDEFMQVHLSARTKPQQDLLLKRLSEITVFESDGSSFAADFILKYLTGLKILRLRNNNERWNSLDCTEYWSKIVDFRNAIDEVYISFWQISLEFISYFCNMENTLTRNPITCNDRVIRRLEVKVDHGFRDPNCAKAYISFKRKLSERSIRVYFSSRGSWRNFFEKRDSEWAIDELALSFHVTSYQKFKLFNSMEPYDEFLKDMPSLKRVIFDTSVSFKENEERYSDLAHPAVEVLTLRWRSDCRVDPQICKLHEKLPNLKHLQFIDYCGRWVSNWYYHLDLISFSLESLSIDVAPVRSLMQQSPGSDFFMVYLTKSKSGEQRAYEISTSLSYYKRISTHEAIHGKPFIFINIPIADLQQLRFFILHDKGSEYCNFDLLRQARSRVYLTINCSEDDRFT